MESSILLAAAGYSFLYTMLRVQTWHEVADEAHQQANSFYWNQKYLQK